MCYWVAGVLKSVEMDSVFPTLSINTLDQHPHFSTPPINTLNQHPSHPINTLIFQHLLFHTPATQSTPFSTPSINTLNQHPQSTPSFPPPHFSTPSSFINNPCNLDTQSLLSGLDCKRREVIIIIIFSFVFYIKPAFFLLVKRL